MKKLFIVFAALCLAVPAMAADWNFYGSARFATFYIDDDVDLPGVDSAENLRWDQQGNSRIGARVKVNDEIGGRFEMSDSFGKRMLYGTYNFGGGELLIGQDYTPSSSYFYSNSVFDSDGDLLGVGQFYVGRVPMIQVTMGGLKVALVRQSTQNFQGFATTESLLPKLEASYGYKADRFFVDVFGGYQTYEIKNNPLAADQDIDSYVVGIGGGANFGPVYFKAHANMGQNYGAYGVYNPAGLRNQAQVQGNQLRDTDDFGFLGVLGFKASDMLTFEAGYGYQESEVDAPGSATDEVEQMYLQAVIGITQGFFVVPEVGMVTKTNGLQRLDEGNEPEVFYLGAKWQINF